MFRQTALMEVHIHYVAYERSASVAKSEYYCDEVLPAMPVCVAPLTPWSSSADMTGGQFL